MHRSMVYTPHLIALTIALLLTACSPLVLVDAVVPDDGYEAETGIAYGPAPRQALDIYRPLAQPAAAAPDKPVVVFLYGGSWRNGARGGYRFVGQALASRGFTVVVPDYRLYPEIRFPAFVEDAAAALAWVHANMAGQDGRPPRIVLMGHSAGAHSAALLALDRRYLEAAGVPATAIIGWIGLAGPYAFDPLAYRSTRPVFQSAADPDDARPITFAGPGAPPALLMHGTADTTVRPENTRALAERLRAAGVAARDVPFDGVGHIGILLNLAKPLQDRAPVLEEIVGFLEGLE